MLCDAGLHDDAAADSRARRSCRRTLHPHDRVEVVTRAGQTLKFKVETIDDAGLHGAGQNVAFDDIESISREKIDAGRTSLIALGVAAVAALAVGGGGGGRQRLLSEARRSKVQPRHHR